MFGNPQRRLMPKPSRIGAFSQYEPVSKLFF